MNFTFGIVVGPKHNSEYLWKLIHSIECQYDAINDNWGHRHKYNNEIILCGDASYLEPYGYNKVAKIIDFDESIKPGWITRKKNLIVQQAQYNNICLLHDYYLLSDNWLKCVSTFDQQWDIYMCQVLNYEGTRHADWMLNPDIIKKELAYCKRCWLEENYRLKVEAIMSTNPSENGPEFINALPYHIDDLNIFQYVSGGYIVGKRDILLKYPQNENLIWGQAEDIDWSHRIAEADVSLKMDIRNTVWIQKPGKWKVTQMRDAREWQSFARNIKENGWKLDRSSGDNLFVQ